MRSRQRTIEINGQQARLAELWRRAWARAIDSLITVFTFIVGGLSYAFGIDFQQSTDWFGRPRDEPSDIWNVIVIFGLILCLMSIAYEVVLTARFGKTIGKAMCGIRVVSLDDGLKPGPPQAFVRWIIPTATGLAGAAVSITILALGINRGRVEGYVSGDELLTNVTYVLLGAFVSWSIVHLSARWDAQGRGWPDKVSRTIVIRE